MRRTAALVLLALTACSGGEEPGRVPVPGRAGAMKAALEVRAARRAFEGAPPVIPHAPIGADCDACHGERGLEVPVLGFAPPSPHARTPGLSALSRCTQCHVYQLGRELFVATSFEGLAPAAGSGTRAHESAPPVLPHRIFMREECHACHDGPAAREELRCTHPERVNCLQCHVPRLADSLFER